MKLNTSYNFLRGGCLFFYRDIFSGLSNETTGAAPYIIPAANPAIQHLMAAANAWQQLLFRYAFRLVKNKLVASLITENVFSVYAQQVSLLPPEEHRNFLQQTTVAKCHQWMYAKPQVFNQRKPKNPT
ncbi:hypothetical protein [Ferruginibacter sp.]